jgi:polyhydroxyalkanoate synthase
MTHGDERLAPARFGRELSRITALTPVTINDWLHRQAHAERFTLPHPAVMREAFGQLGTQMLRHWGRVAESQAHLWRDWTRIWQHNAFGTGELPKAAAAAREDRRFQGEPWRANPTFDLLRQSYYAAADQIREATRDITVDLAPHHRERVRFYTERTVEALAPTNHAATNPEVLQETLRTGGENLLRGSRQALEDLARGHGQLRISQTRIPDFELGRDIATSPGKVIYQNELMQLIQFSPTTETVARRPLLIVPPWINKYYILDLTPRKSFIQWAVNQGLTVFLISWINPDASYAEVGFEDYMRRGPLAALDAIEPATGEREVNTIGYCIGGTLLACTLAWLRARADERVQSATFFTSLLDFSDVGPLSVVHRCRADRAHGGGDEPAWLPRRQPLGQCLQSAPGARPHLGLCGQ